MAAGRSLRGRRALAKPTPPPRNLSPQAQAAQNVILSLMAEPAKDRRKELYDAYLAVPEHLHAEIVRGTLHVMPRPAPRHANTSTILAGRLGGPFQLGDGGPGGWWI